jgi:hypothetical protein
MSYEADPAGLGVGKSYGPREVGGIDGEVALKDMEGYKSFQVTAGTSDDTYETTILQNYLVKSIVLNVKEAYAASSTADFSIDGGAGLTTDLDLATEGVTEITDLTGLANTSGSGPVDLALTLDANAKGSATGDVEITVKYLIAG